MRSASSCDMGMSAAMIVFNWRFVGFFTLSARRVAIRGKISEASNRVTNLALPNDDRLRNTSRLINACSNRSALGVIT